jgi:hypothetical protein
MSENIYEYSNELLLPMVRVFGYFSKKLTNYFLAPFDYTNGAMRVCCLNFKTLLIGDFISVDYIKTVYAIYGC